MKNLKKCLCSFVIAFACFGLFAEHVHFIKSYTDSLPEHYFIQLPKVAPKKGDLTIVYNSFYKGRLIKRIIGQGGDQINSDTSGNLWVGGVCVGKVYNQTATGEKLEPLPNQVIPQDKVFLYAPHPKSFDSRYAQVGLVSVNELEGQIIAIV